MNEELKLIVQRMIDAGEPEENIALVIQKYNSMGKQEGVQTAAAPAAPVNVQEQKVQPITSRRPSPLLEPEFPVGIASNQQLDYQALSDKEKQAVVEIDSIIKNVPQDFINQVNQEAISGPKEVRILMGDDPELKWTQTYETKTVANYDEFKNDAIKQYLKDNPSADEKKITRDQYAPIAQELYKANKIAQYKQSKVKEYLESKEDDFLTISDDIYNIYRKLAPTPYDPQGEATKNENQKAYDKFRQNVSNYYESATEANKAEIQNITNNLNALDVNIAEVVNEHKQYLNEEGELDKNKVQTEEDFNKVRQLNLEYNKYVEKKNKEIERYQDITTQTDDINVLVDLTKRNYNDLEYHTSNIKAGIADLASGAVQATDDLITLSATLSDWQSLVLQEKFGDEVAETPLEKDIMTESSIEKVANFIDKKSQDIRSDVRYQTDMSDVNSAQDAVKYVFDVFSGQAVNTALTIAAPMYSLPVMAASEAGRKGAEMEKEARATGKAPTELQYFGAEIGYGLAEYLSEKVSLGQINAAKKSVQKMLSLDPRLITEVSRNNILLQIGEEYAGNVSKEAFSEGMAKVGQNVVDRLILDKDVNIMQGVDKALLDGAIMSGLGFQAPVVAQQLYQVASTSSQTFKLNANAVEMSSLLKQIDKLSRKKKSNKNLKKISDLKERVNELATESAGLHADIRRNVDDLSDEDKVRLRNIELKSYDLKKEFNSVLENTELTKEQKDKKLNAIAAMLDLHSNLKDKILDNAQYSQERIYAIFNGVRRSEKLGEGIATVESKDGAEFESIDAFVAAVEKALKESGVQEGRAKAYLELAKKSFQENLSEIKGSNGFFIPNTNIMVVNKTEALQADGNAGVFGHEYAHATILKKLLEKNVNLVQLSNMLEKYAKSRFKNASKVFDQVRETYAGSSKEVIAEEMINAFSDFARKYDLKSDLTVAGKLKDFWSKTFGAEADMMGLSNGKDVYEFIVAYNDAFKKGKVSKLEKKINKKIKEREATTKTKKQEAVFSKKQIGDSIRELVKPGTTKAQYDTEVIADVYMDLVASDKLHPLISKNLARYGIAKEQITSEFYEDVKNQLFERTISRFNPEQNDDLGGFVINELQKYSIPDIVNEYKAQGKFEFTEELDAGPSESRVRPMQVADEARTDEAIEIAEEQQAQAKIEGKSFREQLGIEEGDELYNEIVNTVKRAYGSKLPSVTDKKFRSGLLKEFRKTLMKPVKNAMGKGDKYHAFIKKNFKAIIEKVPTREWVQLEQREKNKIFAKIVSTNSSPTQVDNAISNGLYLLPMANRLSGPTIYKKLDPTFKEFWNFLTGNYTDLNGARKTALAERIAQELAFDASMMVLKDPAYDGLSRVMEVSEITGVYVPDNFDAELAKIIERDPSIIKFSKKHKDQYEKSLIRKRTDLTPDQVKFQVDTIFNWIDATNEIPDKKKKKFEELALHYMYQPGFVLPEDGYKLLEAERIADLKDIDAKSYANPTKLIREKGEQISKKYYFENPDNYAFFLNKNQINENITVYDIDNSFQQPLAEFVRSHHGKYNPWCITAITSKTGQANPNIWNNYGVKKMAAFYNGKIISLGVAPQGEVIDIIYNRTDRRDEYDGDIEVVFDRVFGTVFFRNPIRENYVFTLQEAYDNDIIDSINQYEEAIAKASAQEVVPTLYQWWDLNDEPYTNKIPFEEETDLAKSLSTIEYFADTKKAGKAQLVDMQSVEKSKDADGNEVVTVKSYATSEEIGGKYVQMETSTTRNAKDNTITKEVREYDNSGYIEKLDITVTDKNDKKIKTLVEYYSEDDQRVTSRTETYINGNNYVQKHKRGKQITETLYVKKDPFVSVNDPTYNLVESKIIKVTGDISLGEQRSRTVTEKIAVDSRGIVYRETNGNKFLTELDELYNANFKKDVEKYGVRAAVYKASNLNSPWSFDDAIVIKEFGEMNAKEAQNKKDELFNKRMPVESSVRFSKKDKSDKARDKLDLQFNKILEQTTGVKATKEYSKVQAKAAQQRKKTRNFFIPPSAEDFVGLLYSFLDAGKKGDKQLEFFKKNLILPLDEAFNNWARAKYVIAEDFRALRDKHKSVHKKLNDFVPDTNFTIDQAIRIYLYDKAGYDVPGLSEKELDQVNRFMTKKKNLDVFTFANELRPITRIPEGFKKPDENWMATTITGEMYEITQSVVRKEFFEQWKSNADAIFTKANMNKIEAIYGVNFRSALEDMLKRIETGSNRSFSSSKALNAFNDWLNGSVANIMFLNSRSAVLQTTSMINYINWSDNNILKASTAFLDQKQFWTDFTYLFNSPYLKERRSGLQSDLNLAELQAAVANSKNKSKAVINYLLQKGFLPTQIADSFAIASGGAAFYRNRTKAYQDKGMSLKEAEAKAFTDFQELTETTQQSSRPDKISQEQAGPLGRVILAFQNTPSQYAREMKKASLDLINGRGDLKTNISKIVYYAAIQNILFNALQTALFGLAFGDDEELDEEAAKKKKKFADQKYFRIINGTVDSILRGSGIGGAIVATVKNVIIKAIEEEEKGYKMDTGAIVVEALNISPPLGSKARKLKSALDNYKYNKDLISAYGYDLDNPLVTGAAGITAATTNVPLDRVVRKLDNLSGALENDVQAWQRVALIAGWSKWDVGLEDSEKEEIKARVREGNLNERRLGGSGERGTTERKIINR